MAPGHEVRLITPAYVNPFVKHHKNNAVDAEAICEAAQRPTKCFVAVESEEQQASALLFYDKALAETVIDLFKAEVIHRRSPWRGFETVEYSTLEWVDWFTNRRLLKPIGNIPPAEAEARYYAQAEAQPWAA